MTTEKPQVSGLAGSVGSRPQITITDGGDTFVAFVLPGIDLAPRYARSLLMRSRLARHIGDDLVLCLSELVTNAVLHSRSSLPGGRLMVIVQAEGSGVLRVTVLDEGPLGTKDRTALGLPDEHGRGLEIIEALSIEHGHSSLFAGGIYWFRITPARPDAKPDAVPDAPSDAPADARSDTGDVLWLDETETITRCGSGFEAIRDLAAAGRIA